MTISKQHPPSVKLPYTPVAARLQRACVCGKHSGSGGECEECRQQREGSLQRAAIGRSAPAKVPALVQDVLRAPGQPLSTEARTAMEPRFGHDFSQVRLHTDTRAAESARAVNALAYTVGQNIVFDTGQFAPNSVAGRQLLAHELVHTLQQGAAGTTAHAPEQLQLSFPSDSAEVEADRIARSVTSSPAGVVAPRTAAPSLARNVRPNVIDEVDTPLKETLVVGQGKTKDYSWNAKFSIYMYDDTIVVEVRIKLNGKVSEATKRAWLDGINSKWNNKYRFTNGKRTIGLSFWAIFTDLNPHVTVNVVEKPSTSGDWDRTHWDAADPEGDTQGDAASHEFGHMIGNKDEYNLPDGKGGQKTLDGVMAHASQQAKERHFQQFLDWLNAHRTKGETEYKLEKIK